ncbi:hypothetical protein Pmani_001820 [Petrolisthes manimaculis]|uniref:Transmembrane 9 superfamily member n=1 Tax=Petrolisthes manimaculis TaxID=1843537 RepID=A0AAE1QJT9_9EUCA|nr:hypothetical protein Pmani_001820 [Petrolisthes manimaculis]
MTSSITQLPYGYYSLKFCRSEKGLFYKNQNLGEILRGDRIVNAGYVINGSPPGDAPAPAAPAPPKCHILCNNVTQPLTWDDLESQKVIDRIKHQYYVHLILDNLPCATKFKSVDTGENVYERGYRLGFVLDDHMYVNNHLHMRIYYNPHDKDAHGRDGGDAHGAADKNTHDEGFTIVRFEVEPSSVDLSQIKQSVGNNECSFPDKHTPQEVKATGTQLLFTYSVEWVESNVPWASRWDIYLQMSDVQIHWFSIVNSLVVVFFLSGILTMIIIRTLRRDIARYNAEETLEETLEESGWKLVHGDVFRPPRHPKLFSAVIGSGVQIFLMVFATVVLAMLGLLSPSSRGALMTTGILIYAVMGSGAGYFSTRLYLTLKGREWKSTAILTAILYPSCLFTIGLFLNIVLWGRASSGAVPFTTIASLCAIWACMCTPLVCVGAYLGARTGPHTHPIRTNQIPRQIPKQVWYLNPFVSVLMAGILPFGAVFIELFFILSAIWENQYYYLFGFLFLVFLILIISCGQISIVMVYFQLCGEDYNWWWRSVVTSGGSALYVFLYSVFYLYTKLEITEGVSLVLYFGYTLAMVMTFWVMTGAVGFYAAYVFIRNIYSAVKID